MLGLKISDSLPYNLDADNVPIALSLSPLNTTVQKAFSGGARRIRFAIQCNGIVRNVSLTQFLAVFLQGPPGPPGPPGSPGHTGYPGEKVRDSVIIVLPSAIFPVIATK